MYYTNVLRLLELFQSRCFAIYTSSFVASILIHEFKLMKKYDLRITPSIFLRCEISKYEISWHEDKNRCEIISPHFGRGGVAWGAWGAGL